MTTRSRISYLSNLQKNTEGVALFTTLVLLFCVTVFISSSVLLSIAISQHISNVTKERYVYYVARGETTIELNRLLHHDLAVGKHQLVVNNHLTIYVSVQNTNSLWWVYVTARSLRAQDTVSFSFDKVSDRLSSWQDNGPSPFGYLPQV